MQHTAYLVMTIGTLLGMIFIARHYHEKYQPQLQAIRARRQAALVQARMEAIRQHPGMAYAPDSVD